MKTIVTAATLLAALATTASAQQVYINQSTGQVFVIPSTGTSQVGGVGSVGSLFPPAPGVAVVGGAGSVGSVYQPLQQGIVVIGGGK